MDCGTRGACTAWLAALSAADTHFSVSLSLPVSPSSISSLSLSLSEEERAEHPQLTVKIWLRWVGCGARGAWTAWLAAASAADTPLSLSLSLSLPPLSLLSLSLALSRTHTYTLSHAPSPSLSRVQLVPGRLGWRQQGRQTRISLSLSLPLSLRRSLFVLFSLSLSLSLALSLSHAHSRARKSVCRSLSVGCGWYQDGLVRGGKGRRHAARSEERAEYSPIQPARRVIEQLVVAGYGVSWQDGASVGTR